jgi:Domain of Unknown Function (DUF1080)
LQLDPNDPAEALTFTSFPTPANPFDPAEPSVELIAQARRLPEWTIGWRGTHAFEPPTSPVASSSPLETVTLVPFGSQHMRISWFPYLGIPSPTVGAFSEAFDPTWCRRWTVFGGNWLARDGTLSTVPGSAFGAKALAMATAFTNFTYEADVSVGGRGDAGLIFRVSKPDIGADTYCGYYAGISPEHSALEFGCASNAWVPLASVPMTFAPNKFYHLKIEANGSHFKIFVDHAEEPASAVEDDHFSSGMVGVRDYCPDGDQSISSFAHPTANELEP